MDFGSDNFDQMVKKEFAKYFVCFAWFCLLKIEDCGDGNTTNSESLKWIISVLSSEFQVPFLYVFWSWVVRFGIWLS